MADEPVKSILDVIAEILTTGLDDECKSIIGDGITVTIIVKDTGQVVVGE